MTVFHLVRHGHYGLLDSGVLAGRTPGHSLDAEGRAQADAIARTLGDRPIAAIVSGPLERALETAAPLAQRLGLPVRIDDAIDELDFGEWTGRSWSTLDGDPAWSDWNRFRATAAVPGGETAGAVADRALGLLRRLGAEYRAGDAAEAEIALFSHADVIRKVIATLLGVPIDLARRIAIDPGGRAVVRLAPGRSPAVLALNLPP